jgi:hypothetical protein
MMLSSYTIRRRLLETAGTHNLHLTFKAVEHQLHRTSTRDSSYTIPHFRFKQQLHNTSLPLETAATQYFTAA